MITALLAGFFEFGFDFKPRAIYQPVEA